MRAKPFIIGALLSLVVIAAALAVAAASRADKYEPQAEGSCAVTAGEIENLINAGDTQAAVLKAQQLKADARLAKNSRREGSNVGIWIVCAVAVVIVNSCIAYIYFSILKPFRRLEKFADKIALGDFSEALDIERGNYFGKFTWAFDSMRREIIKSRSCEREALENNKTVIASLSHDLKTPVASISAYSEALVNGLYSSTEEMYSYLDVISKKCEEIAKITGDMITHSIGELGALKMEPTHFDLVQLLESAVSESSVGGDIHFEK
ncbi:MAG: HAMP domain-containing histidine kinase, partial [Ruminococcus sp.]|nr:HAMP domain-containing histidine kinase [Ruminococcus sp.]